MSISIVDSNPKKLPSFAKLLFFVEMWERFSYYGMRALLVLFLTSKLGFSDERAFAVYSMFAAIGYAMPIVAGILADRLMGFRNLVIIGGSIMVLGHLLMALVAIDSDLVFFGLAFIIVGTGLFKGNITNLLGSCYKEGDPGRARGFSLFYVGVNLGSFLASISCGYVGSVYGWHYGFGLAGIGMTIGLITFVTFQDLLGEHGHAPNPRLLTIKVFSIFVFLMLITGFLISFILQTEGKMFKEVMQYFGIFVGLSLIYIAMFKSGKQEAKNIMILLIFIIFFTCFFGLEMQLGSLMNLFTARNIDSEIFGKMVPAAVSQAINPISIVIFGSIFAKYLKYDKKHDLIRFALGLVCMAICFLTLYLGCLSADEAGKVSYIYLLVAISYMGIGELFVSPFLLEQATLLAPKHFKGFIMGVVMFSLSLSNLAGMIISKFISVPSVEGEIDRFVSLEIYKNGFFKIFEFNVIVVLVFIIIMPLLKKLRKPGLNHVSANQDIPSTIG